MQTSLQCFKPSCAAALRRIFKLNDANKDGVLDASELNEFQVSLVSASNIERHHEL